MSMHHLLHGGTTNSIKPDPSSLMANVLVHAKDQTKLSNLLHGSLITSTTHVKEEPQMSLVQGHVEINKFRTGGQYPGNDTEKVPSQGRQSRDQDIADKFKPSESVSGGSGEDWTDGDKNTREVTNTSFPTISLPGANVQM